MQKLGEDLDLDGAQCFQGIERDAEEGRQDWERQWAFPSFGMTNIPLLVYVNWGDTTKGGCVWTILVVLPQQCHSLGEGHAVRRHWGRVEVQTHKSHVRQLLKGQLFMEPFKEFTYVSYGNPAFGPCDVEGRSTPCCGPERSWQSENCSLIQSFEKELCHFLFLLPYSNQEGEERGEDGTWVLLWYLPPSQQLLLEREKEKCFASA